MLLLDDRQRAGEPVGLVQVQHVLPLRHAGLDHLRHDHRLRHNSYLNLSLFLGLALLYPDFQVNLFFFLPGLGEVSGADRRGGAGGELRDGNGIHPHRACDGAFERAAVLRRKPDSARQERVPPLQMEEILPEMNPTGSLRWMKRPCLFLVQSRSCAEGCGCSVSVWGTMLCMMFSR